MPCHRQKSTGMNYLRRMMEPFIFEITSVISLNNYFIQISNEARYILYYYYSCNRLSIQSYILFLMIFTVIFLALFILFCIYLIYQPWKRYQAYVKAFQSKGYKVYKVPFIPLFIPFLKIIKKGLKEGDPMKEIKKIYSQNDLTISNAFGRIVIDLSHPDLIKDFYAVDKVYIYPKSKALTGPISRTMGAGIPFSEGDIWRRKRRIINRVFNFQFIRNMTDTIKDICIEAIKTTESNSLDLSGCYEYQILNLTTQMFSNVILQCFLGGAAKIKLDGQRIATFVNSLMSDATRQGSKPHALLFGVQALNLGLTAKDRDINRRIRIFRQWGQEFIKKRIEDAKERVKADEKKTPTDIIQALVKDCYDEKDKEQKYSEDQILEQFSTFFVAGTDTTAHLMVMMIYYITLNPLVEQKLREQIQYNMKDMDFSFDNLKKLRYIDYIQKQTMRMYGPITGLFVRDIQQDNLLDEIKIYKGTYMSIQHIGNHYSSKYFKEPTQFRPERWQRECDQLPPYVTGGFSAGARTCIGKHLALLQSKIGLIVFYLRYRQVKIPKKDIKMVLNFVYAPESFKSKMSVDEKTKPIFT